MDIPEIRAKNNRELFTRLFAETKNSLPIWIYKGYSKNEFVEMHKIKDATGQDIEKFIAVAKEVSRELD